MRSRNNSLLHPEQNEVFISQSETKETETKENPVAREEVVTFYEDGYLLILWNDDVNDMFDVVVALYEVCGIAEKNCVNTMLVAHYYGSSVIKPGTLSELRKLDEGMRARNLTTTIERIQTDNN